MCVEGSTKLKRFSPSNSATNGLAPDFPTASVLFVRACQNSSENPGKTSQSEFSKMKFVRNHRVCWICFDFQGVDVSSVSRVDWCVHALMCRC